MENNDLKIVEQLAVQTISLAVQDYEMNHSTDRELLSAIEPRVWIDPLLGRFVCQFRVRFPHEILCQERWPADWWEAFRERWFPNWWLERYPVKYKGIQLDAVYTSISVPKMNPRFVVQKISGFNPN